MFPQNYPQMERDWNDWFIKDEHTPMDEPTDAQCIKFSLKSCGEVRQYLADKPDAPHLSFVDLDFLEHIFRLAWMKGYTFGSNGGVANTLTDVEKEQYQKAIDLSKDWKDGLVLQQLEVLRTSTGL